MMLPERPAQPVTPATRDELDTYAARVADEISSDPIGDNVKSLADRRPVVIVEARDEHGPTHRVAENGLLAWCLDCQWWVK